MKYIKNIVAVLALAVIVLPIVALADVGAGSWRTSIFDGDSYNNVSTNPPSTTTPEFLGTNTTGDSPSWMWFDPAHFTVTSAKAPGSSSGGFEYKILLHGLSDGDIGSLSDDYVSTSTLASTVATINSSITSAVAGVSGSGGLTLASVMAFMSNQATTSQLVASSTFNGFMSSTSATTMANLKTVATSGSYNDLTSKPSLGIAYEGTTQRTGAFPIFKTGTVSGGTVAFNLTADGTSGGTALCTNGVIQDSVQYVVNDATAAYQMGWAFSNSNKTLTFTANKLTTANILTGILGQGQANGSAVKLTVWCY